MNEGERETAPVVLRALSPSACFLSHCPVPRNAKHGNHGREKTEEGRGREEVLQEELWASLRGGVYLLIHGIKRKSSNSELGSIPPGSSSSHSLNSVVLSC